MTQQPPAVNPWSDDDNSAFLRLRMKTFWNGDYFERIVLLRERFSSPFWDTD